MHVYVARQPIFDRKMRVYGYELFYRGGTKNYFEGIEDNQATSELINNVFLTMQLEDLTFGSRAFINFSEDLIVKGIPLALPKDEVVIEILERVNPTPEVIEACKNLKEQGYILALDDFNFNQKYLSLIELADIIKVEYGKIDIEVQKRIIKAFKGRTKFLSEKVETREQYKIARDMGYDYFQGYFFSKPIIVKSNERKVLNTSLLRIATELNKQFVDFNKITEICEHDVDLTYKILKISNYVQYGTRYEVKSIKHALAVLGVDELKKWVYLMMFKDTRDKQNNEVIKNSLIRGKLMELLAKEAGLGRRSEEYFVTGLFSLIDVLLCKEMKEIVSEIPFSSSIKDALLKDGSDIAKTLDKINSFEKAKWDELQNKGTFNVENDRFMELYVEALKWAGEIEL
ncbi:HDOD domain-containing protein [Clostridium sp. 'deep sea']|uniref:EAL and HDOD domain-containing protein n=1 Tax=Clostridium sp. 'deep sea' TaxID=2779445 RepID=UPI00189649F6|nr:HDOD domain-containing protein [Clostridium sp. 'deep sea']QOR35376.1 HDOD domain-containing protein [Clostridium sp. 'deep sea']